MRLQFTVVQQQTEKRNSPKNPFFNRESIAFLQKNRIELVEDDDIERF